MNEGDSPFLLYVFIVTYRALNVEHNNNNNNNNNNLIKTLMVIEIPEKHF